jgi:hypothetical protein
MPEQILISLDELKKMKLSEKQLLLTIFLVDYYSLKENDNPRGIKSLREKCEYLLGYKVTTT